MTRSPAEVMVELAPRIRFYLNEAAFGATFTEKGQAEMRELCDKIDAALAASPLSLEITDEMVRRVARAIFDNGATTEWTPEIGERLGKQARAAILAMQSVAALRSSGIDGGE